MSRLFTCLFLILSALSGICYATEAAGTNSEPIMVSLMDSLDCQVKSLAFWEWTEPAHTPVNPENQFLKLSKNTAQYHFRPDLEFKLDRFQFQFKPRLIAQWEHWDNGLDESDTTDIDIFVNEWSIRAPLGDSLFLIGGRENLQWGPSYLCSLSNPFFTDNGKNNPNKEVPGMDFVRMVYLPDDQWTISGIANVNEGNADIDSDSFRAGYALKVDYYGTQSYAGLIVSYQEDPEEYRVGYYAGLTVSDALIIYTEGMTSHNGIYGLYPADADTSVGKEFTTQTYDLLERGSVLVGGSYTTESGPTLTLEYLYYGYGYDDEQASDYFSAVDAASRGYFQAGAVRGLSKQILGQALSTDLQFLRKNYVMLQINDSDVYDRLDYTFRCTYSIDDHSGLLLFLLDFSVTDSIRFFSVFKTQFGSTHSDYGSDIIDPYGMFGIEYTF
jgi:hypothetical protein